MILLFFFSTALKRRWLDLSEKLVENKTQVRFLPATLPKATMNLGSGIFQWEIFQSEIASAWVWEKEIHFFFLRQALRKFYLEMEKISGWEKKKKEKKAFLTYTFWSALLFLFRKMRTPMSSNSLWSASTFSGVLICSCLWSSQLLERRVYK